MKIRSTSPLWGMSALLLALCSAACAGDRPATYQSAPLGAFAGPEEGDGGGAVSQPSAENRQGAAPSSDERQSPPVLTTAGQGRQFRQSEAHLAFAKAAARPASTSDLAQQGRGGQKENAAQSSLEQLVRIAIESHPSVTSKLADRQGAEADVQSARWQYFPTPSAGVRRTDGNGTTTVYALQQPLWAWGRIDAGLDAARAKSVSAEISVLEARHNLAVGIAAAYQSWMQSVGRSEAYLRAQEFHEAQAASIRRRVEGGLSADVDLELVNSRLAQVGADLSAAQAGTRVALARLSQYVGISIRSSDLKRASPDKMSGKDLPPSLEAILEEVPVWSPTLRRLGSDIEVSQHEVRAKRASALPTLSLRGERQESSSLPSGASGFSNNSVMVTIDFAPGAGLSSLSATESAQAKVQALRSTREAAHRDLLDRVSTDYEEYRASRRRRDDLERTKKSALQVLASYSRQFEAGKRSWLDVMNAARELTQVDASLADVDAQIVAARYRLQLYLGHPDWYRWVNQEN